MKGFKGISVDIDGQIKKISDSSMSKERLASKPFKIITKCGRRLSVGFNLEAAQLTLKHNGENVEKLPEVEKKLQICRNKTTKISNDDQRYVSLIGILIFPSLLIIWLVMFIE